LDDSHTFFWLVGVFEGEAYFGYAIGQKRPIIEVEMKDEHVVARVAAILGASYYRRDRRDSRPNSSVTYRVSISGKRALQLMKRLQPYLSPRRARTIAQVEEAFLRDARDAPRYDKIPLPPLVEVPYMVER